MATQDNSNASRLLALSIYSSLIVTFLASLPIPLSIDGTNHASLYNYLSLLCVQLLSIIVIYVIGSILRSFQYRLPDLLALTLSCIPAFLLGAMMAMILFRDTTFSDLSKPALAASLFALAAVAPFALSCLFILASSLMRDRWHLALGSFLSLTFLLYRSFGMEVPVPVQREVEIPTVVLVTLDTTGREYLDAADNARNTHFPAFKRFARNGIIATNALAASSWTYPSHAVLFTGEAFYEGTARELSHNNDTITEAYKSHGYATIGVSANAFLREDNGFSQGFDHFVTMPENSFHEYNVIGGLS